MWDCCDKVVQSFTSFFQNTLTSVLSVNFKRSKTAPNSVNKTCRTSADRLIWNFCGALQVKDLKSQKPEHWQEKAISWNKITATLFLFYFSRQVFIWKPVCYFNNSSCVWYSSAGRFFSFASCCLLVLMFWRRLVIAMLHRSIVESQVWEVKAL